MGIRTPCWFDRHLDNIYQPKRKGKSLRQNNVLCLF
jgi:hypothetical protein